MSFNASHPLAAKNICRILVKQGLISLDKAKEILLKENDIRSKIGGKKKHKENNNSEGALKFNDPFEFIELLVHLNF